MAENEEINDKEAKDADDDDLDEEFMATARKRFKTAMDASSENRRNQVDDVKFAAGSPDNNWQWPEPLLRQRLSNENPGGPRPCLTINKLPQHIKLVTNEQRQNRPAIKVIPVDEDADVAVADIFSGIIRHIEVSSDSDIAYDTACENQVTHGEGYFRVLTQYVDEMAVDEQDIIIAPIENSFAVYLDPDGLRKDPTGSKCEWGFITDELTREEFKKKWPDAAGPTDWELMAQGDETRIWFEGQNVRIAEYFLFESEKKTICKWSDGSVTVKKEGYKPPDGVTLIKERETVIKKCKWHKINGYESLEETSWPGKYIPIVRIVGNEWVVEGKTIVSGIVRNAKDAQRMGNYFESMDTEFIALAPKAPFIGAVGQFATMSEEWGKANTVPYSRLEYDPIDVNGVPLPPPQRQMPPQASSGILQAKLAAWDNVQSTVGQYNPSLGAEAKEKSGVAINARQRQADVGTFHYVDNLSRGIRFLGRILIDVVPKIYDTKRVARIMGLDGVPGQCNIDPDQDCAVLNFKNEAGDIEKIYNPSVGKYDVTVQTGPGYNSKRQEAAEFMAQVLQGNPDMMQVMGDLYFKMLDVPGADKIAARIKRSIPPQLTQDENDNKADPAVQQQQIKQAAEMLGQREAELNAHEQQLQEQGKLVSEQEQKAKDAMGKVQAEVNKLNSLMEALKNDRELFDLQKQLAEKDIELQSSQLESEKKIIEAEVKTIQAKMDSKLTEINNAAESAAQTKLDIESSSKDLLAAMAEVAKLVSAKRTTKLLTDDQGNPVGSESTLEVA